MSRKEIDLTRVNSILLNGYSGHAESIRWTPLLRALRAKYPNAKIAVLVFSPWVAEILERCPYIDELIIAHSGPGRPSVGDAAKVGRIEKLGQLVSTVRAIRGKFDLYVGSPNIAPRFDGLIALFSGCRYRVGFGGAFIPFAWTNELGDPDWNVTREEHMDELYRAIGVDNVDPQIETWPTDDDNVHVDNFLRSHGVESEDTLIGIHPGSDWGCQEWNPVNWAQLANSIDRRHQVKFVVTGTKEDLPTFEAISTLTSAKLISAVGETSIGQLSALVRRYSALVSVDTVAVPIGLSAKIPVVALNFRNPSPWVESRLPNLTVLNPPKWFPRDTFPQVCRQKPSNQELGFCRSTCMGGSETVSNLVTPEQVLDAIESAKLPDSVKI